MLTWRPTLRSIEDRDILQAVFIVLMFHSLARLGPGLAFLLSIFAFQLVIALPTEFGDYDLFNDTASNSFDRRAPNFYARILPLGASIVQGRGSSTGNGFRKFLRDQLRKDGWRVNMVGSKSEGSMADNSVEAIPGYTVSQIQDISHLSTPFKPNIILVNAGVNDCENGIDIPNIGARLASLLDDLFKDVPGTTVIVSTLIPGTDPDVERFRAEANRQYRSLVSDRRARGQKVVLAEMDGVVGYFDTRVGSGDYFDETHPNDKGYTKMAAIWRQAINTAESEGKLTAPADAPGVVDSGDNTCEKHSTEETSFWLATIATRNGLDDIIQIGGNVAGGRSYSVYRNRGAATWDATPTTFTIPDACIARGVRWADMNGDGLDDFVCIAPGGELSVAINRGNFVFEYTGAGKYKPSEGYLQARIHLADIDGDGRFDYCAARDNGDIQCWRNGGRSDTADLWQDMGIVFTGKNMGDLSGIRFGDINGDGRSDWLWLNDQGATWTWTNSRGCIKGAEGQGLTPTWRAGENRANGAGPTHIGLGFADARSGIHFAKAFGNPQAYNLLPGRDYVWIEHTSSSGLRSTSSPTDETTGFSTTSTQGDDLIPSVNLTTRSPDYVWIFSNGKMQIFEGLDSFPENPPYWGNNYVMFDLTGSRAMDRRDLHLADWNGDGACDIIYTNPDGGAVEVWLNRIKTTGNFNWEYVGNPAPKLSCDQTRGVGINDLAVRFADLSGNGRPDYLCMEKDGRTKGYLHNSDGSFTWIPQFKKTDNFDRANYRWADVNGDGRADLIWTDKFKGDATVWTNQGMIQSGDSSFTWVNKGPLYNAPAQGHCLHFPDLDGNRRADMHFVDAVENSAQTWFNTCPNGSSDDADTLTSPVLPSPP
ncbi:hypothetical protein J7T55_002216 [Diaporthe amygdali]|uniref:uncharacterized protein n=1 Tax=Phomopsis amygdali TaxID=1214568 RepID=UPI0022FE8D1A|nr:uncharacterized protein J7T55_002216 [Diaporthe amygdali]KAJ0109024.1 hypothetical protein J7T55_002216 [Diaporthe amygdali]